MERKEYLLSELPEELRLQYDAVSVISQATLGFTLGGIRYRIYRDEEAKVACKAAADIMDALKGAELPTEDITASMDKLGITEADRGVILADIAKAIASKKPQPEQETV